MTIYIRKPGQLRSAAFSAFLWKVLVMLRTSGVGIVALLTLYIGWKTLGEYKRQNDIVQKQTLALIDQNQYLQRSANVVDLSSLVEDIELKRDKIGVHPDSTWELPRSLIYRIVAVSKLFDPNVFTTGDSARLISPERGLLLKALVDNKIDFPLVPNPNFASADLQNVILTGADLNGVNLTEADLTGAELSGADLSWANLTKAKLNDAHIANANLNGAFLTGADLRWANLFNADLTNAHLGKANFNGAYLMETNLVSVIGLSVDQLCSTNILLNARLDSLMVVAVNNNCPGKLGSTNSKDNRTH
ncbi:MAG: hypothetical protein GF353_20895 [Candidatus Lokiarchaeota archaeon]|nr:hypothetical protein [Candidatus Lokiarchaeota archaeon]